ncbi:MAG: hypothetical protein JXR31_12700 [Prolixibacteraceae bacterium]|nr:hypothetical protein [Prolixibacteraceae bacterium]MBN2775107.1 hypothetical protein [Prolixibacteraceae bacterium]
MWKSVIYKEWLKTRWFLIIYAAIGVLAVGRIFLKVQHDFTFNEATNFWYVILFQGYQYFGILKFLPALGGLIIAVSQFFPETVNKRIKLTFHLPIVENKVMIIMMLFGACCLLLTFGVVSLFFYGLSIIYFPHEIIHGALVTMTPWFLAGLAIYFLAALIILEPVWKFRFLYALVAVAFIPSVFFDDTITGGYSPANPVLFVLVIIMSTALLFSGYRFRKGEM